jgi:hypothetical protein
MCAKDGEASGIVFNILKEVEKEVVLIDPSPTSNPASTTNAENGDAMLVDVDGKPAVPDSLAGPQVLKIIKKVEAQVLCSQHNPVWRFLLHKDLMLIVFISGCCYCKEGCQARQDQE